MRLTLRTLLAYMDGILDPADHESMTQQIEASEAASELMHQATDVTRRLRLPAPPLEDDPAGFDANEVAEYLDNTLPPAEVDKLQNHCLVSDQHLAEVTSCHHILKMILEGNVKVDPETRRRMYAVPEVADALEQQRKALEAAAKAGIAQTVVTPPATDPKADESIHEVPEYLRENQPSTVSNWWPAIAALLLLGATSFMAFRPGGWLRQEDPPVVASNDETNTTLANGSEEGKPSEGEQATEGTTTPNEGKAGETTVGDSEPKDPSEDSVEGTAPVKSNGENAKSGDGETAEGEQQQGDSSSTTGKPETSADGEADGVDGGNTEDGDGAPNETDKEPKTPTADQDDPTEDETPEPPPEPIVTGEYLSTKQVLLRQNKGTDQWSRLPPGAEIMTGDRLLALPTYFCAVKLGAKLNLELTDGTQVQLGSQHPEEGATVKVELLYGRIVLTNTSEAELAVPLVVGELRGTAQLAAGSVLAIEAARPFYDGNDPAKTLAPISGIFYATQGGLTWNGDNPAGEFAIDQPALWRIQGALIDNALPYSEQDAPAWIKGRELVIWETVASKYVEEELNTNQMIWPQLLELSNSKRKEASALAAISSAHVGSFDPNIKALGDPDHKRAWEEEIRTLRFVMSQSAELANKVRESIRERLGSELEEDLYKLLCSYSHEELTGGAGEAPLPNGPVAQWIDWLASPHLEYRVLANENLTALTTMPRYFNPGGLKSGRDQAVARIKNRLRDGKIEVPLQ